MLHNRCATVKMEEGYMRVTIEYTDYRCRSIICDTIGKVEKEMDAYPEVIHRRVGDNKGTYSVEFSGEDYICSRTSGEFVEKLLEELEIVQCDCS